jgi:hypothetical protein
MTKMKKAWCNNQASMAETIENIERNEKPGGYYGESISQLMKM